MTTIDTVPLGALAVFALLLIGVASIRKTFLSVSRDSSADRARFLIIMVWGFIVAICACLPVWLTWWLEDVELVFRIATGVFLVLLLSAIRWRNSHQHIPALLQRVYLETRFPTRFSVGLFVATLALVLLNIVSWPLVANQWFYGLVLVITLVQVLLHFVNLVVYRLEDNAILENPINVEGWEAVIYRDPDDDKKVLKLFYDTDESFVAEEVRMATAAAEAGLPCPAVYGGIVEMNGRFGFYMEKIDGLAFENQGIYSFTQKGRRLCEEFGRFHVQLHEVEGIEMPIKFKDVAQTSIQNAPRISIEDKQHILDLLKSLPDGDRVYHGDFHPGNVIRCNDNSRMVIVDWARAMTGHPLADVARASVILSTAWLEMLPIYRWWIKKSVQVFSKRYEEAYFRVSNFEPVDIEPWRVIATAMRMGEEPIHDREVRFLAKRLNRYLRNL